ncbi:MAG TPA: 50S ribosomal protein L9 [Candidatus Paceibacterota bacterium]|nr:50S ribosomal protein L9 [Candidatus Paceibacterota bacterium]
MQVIFLKDVAKQGRRGEVKEVSDGYAQNMLLPRGLAEAATPAKVAAIKAKMAESEAANAASAEALAARVRGLDGTRVELAAKADPTGHLYQKLDAAKIAEAIGVPASAITHAEPIKELGEHVIALSAGKAKASVTLLVTAQG